MKTLREEVWETSNCSRGFLCIQPESRQPARSFETPLMFPQGGTVSILVRRSIQVREDAATLPPEAAAKCRINICKSLLNSSETQHFESAELREVA